METDGSMDRSEAAAALRAVRDSRARVAWRGFPVWYWLATGTCLGVGTAAMLLPDWWDVVIAAGVTVAMVAVARAAGRARGVCEGWFRSAMTWPEGIVLYGPAVVLIQLSAVASRFGWWRPWLPIGSAMLVVALFAAAGLALSARAARR
jgi:hypothetical protein